MKLIARQIINKYYMDNIQSIVNYTYNLDKLKIINIRQEGGAYKYGSNNRN